MARLFRRLLEFSVALQFTLLLFLAVLWWWMMPKGFPAWHPRFWMNTVFPPIIITVSLAAMTDIVRQRSTAVTRWQIALLAVTATAALTGAVVFPRSLLAPQWLIPIGAAFCCVLFNTLLLRRDHRNEQQGPRQHAHLLAAACIGVFVPYSQRAPAPGTVPAGDSHELPEQLPQSAAGRSVRLASNASVQPRSGTIILDHQTSSLHIEPLLSFISTSPDGFWTLFSPSRPQPHRLLSSGLQSSGFVAAYQSDHASTLNVSAAPDTNTIEIAARSWLPRTVYSHLNSYTRLTLFSRQLPSLSFAPGEGPIPILPADYPIGRPARFATMTPDAGLRVMEASSGEKGPFTVLREIPLHRSDPLVLTLHVGTQPVYRVTFLDWSAQADTQLSPTAGWRVPVNAIEFSLDESGQVAVIDLTLAATSIGRGWDSVGHKSGAYLNRMRVEALGPAVSD